MLIKFETKWTPTLRSFTQETLSDSVLENPIPWKFASETSSEVLITSVVSRVRVIDGVDLVDTFKALLAIFGDEKNG